MKESLSQAAYCISILGKNRQPIKIDQGGQTMEHDHLCGQVLLPGAGRPGNVRPFTGILGYDGYIRTQSSGGYWEMRTYYAQEGGRTFPIAESFGFDGVKDYHFY